MSLSSRRRRRLAGRLVVAATIAVAVGGAVYAVRLAEARNALSQAKGSLSQVGDDLRAARVDDARLALERAGQRLDRARKASGAFPLGVLARVPLVGSPAAAAADATDAGTHMAAALGGLVGAVEAFPTSGQIGVDGGDLSAFHVAATDAGTALTTAAGRLDAARRSLEGPAGALLPPVSRPARELLGLVDRAGDQLDGARRGVGVLGWLTAPSTEARLLVLAQDTMELRPSGGYVGSFGILRFRAGTVELERYASFEDLPDATPPLEPPADLKAALRGAWGLENSGWWPDFPTSAATAAELFARQGGGPVDGVVAITEQVMAELVGELGPVTVPGYVEPVTEAGFAQRVLYEVELKRPLDVPRKRFLIGLAHELFGRLFRLDADHLPAVARALESAVGAGDVQLWLADPERQALVAGTVIAGELPDPAPPGDFLLVTDANLTASKANRDLTRELVYRVEREPSPAGLVGRLTLRYRNRGQASPSTNPYYNGYTRIYVPAGSELVGDADGRVRDLGPAPDGPYRVWALDMFVALGEQVELTVGWRLPRSVTADDYRLTWLRQPGTPTDSVLAEVAGRSHAGDPSRRALVVADRVR